MKNRMGNFTLMFRIREQRLTSSPESPGAEASSGFLLGFIVTGVPSSPIPKWSARDFPVAERVRERVVGGVVFLAERKRGRVSRVLLAISKLLAMNQIMRSVL